MAVVTDPTLGTGKTIGKYFGIVSVVPSVLLTGWLFVVFATGAAGGTPSAAQAFRAIKDLSIAGVIALFAFALLAALALHPLQFAIVQFLEGYWGDNPLMRALRLRRTLVHLHRLNDAYALLARSAPEVEPDLTTAEMLTSDELTRDPLRAAALVADLITAENSGATTLRYPTAPEHVMPTRLGNVLRRHEMRAGAPYGLSLLSTSTMLGLVASPTHVAYLNDRRSELDLAARMCAVGLAGTAVTGAVMWPHGLWLLLAGGPYLLAWLSYRGAVVSAGHYGQALEALVSLNRFALYDALRLQQPSTPAREKKQNRDFATLLEGLDPKTLLYKHPTWPVVGGEGSGGGIGQRATSAS